MWRIVHIKMPTLKRGSGKTGSYGEILYLTGKTENKCSKCGGTPGSGLLVEKEAPRIFLSNGAFLQGRAFFSCGEAFSFTEGKLSGRSSERTGRASDGVICRFRNAPGMYRIYNAVFSGVFFWFLTSECFLPKIFVGDFHGERTAKFFAWGAHLKFFRRGVFLRGKVRCFLCRRFVGCRLFCLFSAAFCGGGTRRFFRAEGTKNKKYTIPHNPHFPQETEKSTRENRRIRVENRK